MEFVQSSNVAVTAEAAGGVRGRVAYWDIAKAFAIFCVVWGHCLQNMTGDSLYWSTDGLSQVIYSFHMPLFMLISGYFAYNSLSKPFMPTMKRKFVQLIIPASAWALVYYALVSIYHRDFVMNMSTVHDIAVRVVTSLWFLKVLFLCYLITLVGAVLYRWSRYTLPVYVILIIALGEQLIWFNTFSMLPFFVGGLLLHHREGKVSLKMRNVAVICAALVFVSLLLIYDSAEYNVYMNPFRHNGGGYKSFVIRTLIGLSGAFTVLWAIKSVFSSGRLGGGAFAGLLARLGTLTLGIYCVQVLFAETLLRHTAATLDSMLASISRPGAQLLYDFVITAVAALLTVAVCCLIIRLLQRNRYTRLIFLGEMPKN